MLPASPERANGFKDMHIARELVDADAEKVVTRLARNRYQAYLVGGCVRDLLLHRTPKDFDVATNATPAQIRSLFRNCRIIGRRFRLVHIFFGSKIIETSTFRANPREDADADEDEELLIRRDNVFGTDTEDARRRDFTINGLFYDVEAERVIDHVGGLDDLRAGLVRTIGDPDIRFREDPVRMMRAIKFAARLGFEIEGNTLAALIRHRSELSKCSQPRVLEEIHRLLRGGAARRSMELLVETGLASILSGHLAGLLGGGQTPKLDPNGVHGLGAPTNDSDEDAWASTWSDAGDDMVAAEPIPELTLSYLQDPKEIEQRRQLAWNMLGQIDRLCAEGREISNSLAISALIAPFAAPDLADPALRPADANAMAQEVLQPLVEQLRLARRDTERTRQIVLAQRRLDPARRRRGKPMVLVGRDYFDEALTIYELLGAAAGEERADSEYWRNLQNHGSAGREDKRQRKRRRGGRRRRRGDDHPSSAEPAVG